MHRRWLVNRTNPEFIEYLSRTASISPVLTQILVNRGIKTSAEISEFLNPHISRLSDPFDMDGMKVAVDRILAASRNGEKVFVHGDYDADGLSAAAIAFGALKSLGIDCRPFIPHRLEHGYGFNPSSVRIAKQIGASLIITVDCGISSFEAASLAKQEGIDVIITDHHEPVRRNNASDTAKQDIRSGSEERALLLPDALVIIDPKISGPGSPVIDLSGAGIAFKLAQALCTVSESGTSIYDFLDLAALGTMADVVPLRGENRIIVKEGLHLIQRGTRPGLRALKQVSGIDRKEARTGLLLFSLIPRINAAGRIDDAGRVLDLLLTDSPDRAAEIAQWLDHLNSERQQIEEEVYRKALSMLNEKGVRPVIVLSSEGWNRGVIGIVASRLADKFYRPTFILSVEDHIARGSARSIPSFDIHEALGACKGLLKNFGGHKQAAGLELNAGSIASFEERINRIAVEALSEEDFLPSLELDASVALSDVGFDLIRDLGMLEPFGCGNPEPILGSKGLEVLYPKIVKDIHLKMKLRQGSQSFDAIGFNLAHFLEELGDASTVDAVYTPSVNEWEGRRSVQLNLKALRPNP